MRFFAACMIALLCSRPLLVDWSYRACVKIVAPRPSSMPLPQQAGARLVRLVQGTVGMQAQRSVQRTWLRSQLPHPASGVGCCGRALYLNSRGILARCVHGCGTGLGAVLKRHASWEANRRTGMLFWIGHRANMGLVRAKLLQDRHRHFQLACLRCCWVADIVQLCLYRSYAWFACFGCNACKLSCKWCCFFCNTLQH